MAEYSVDDFLQGMADAAEEKRLRELDDQVTEAEIKKSLKKESPFTYINSINHKQPMENLRDYNAFMTDRFFSMHADTIMFAAVMNRFPGLSKQMQYDYYYNAVRKSKRAWWYKAVGKHDIDVTVETVMETFQCSKDKAMKIIEDYQEINPDSLIKLVDGYIRRKGGRS